MLTTKVKGVCPHDCPDVCGVITEVESEKAIRFYGDPDHSVTQGWLCGKVRPYLQHVYHPERLRYPLRRVGAKAFRGRFFTLMDYLLPPSGDKSPAYKTALHK